LPRSPGEDERARQLRRRARRPRPNCRSIQGTLVWPGKSRHARTCPALLLIRIAETHTGDTWRNLRHELDRLHAGEFSGNTGRVLQRHDLTPDQQAILAALDVREPPRFLDFTPA
jgi:hypothetical protein